MPVSPFSRYRHLSVLEVWHPSRVVTRSLPIRRSARVGPLSRGRPHRFASYETADLLAWKYLGREDLFWHLLDANGGQLPDDLEPGEMLQIPPLSLATRIERSG